MTRPRSTAAGASVSGLSDALERVFPAFVAVAVVGVGDADPLSAHAQERAAVAGAAPVRREQFLAGRACAHAALRGLGRDGPAVLRAPTRAPLWPPGVVGSIAHTAEVAGAAVASAEDAWGLGLDIERIEPALEPDVERLVCTPAERAAHRLLGPSAGKLVFCAKECVYKCVSPATGWSLDFDDVEVLLDASRGRFEAVVDERFRLEGRPLPPLRGGFVIVGGVVLAGLTGERFRV